MYIFQTVQKKVGTGRRNPPVEDARPSGSAGITILLFPLRLVGQKDDKPVLGGEREAVAEGFV